jgi:hypothetical protein
VKLRQPDQVEAAMAQHATALLHAVNTAVANVTPLEQLNRAGVSGGSIL